MRQHAAHELPLARYAVLGRAITAICLRTQHMPTPGPFDILHRTYMSVSSPPRRPSARADPGRPGCWRRSAASSPAAGAGSEHQLPLQLRYAHRYARWSAGYYKHLAAAQARRGGRWSRSQRAQPTLSRLCCRASSSKPMLADPPARARVSDGVRLLRLGHTRRNKRRLARLGLLGPPALADDDLAVARGRDSSHRLQRHRCNVAHAPLSPPLPAGAYAYAAGSGMLPAGRAAACASALCPPLRRRRQFPPRRAGPAQGVVSRPQSI